MTKEVKKTAPIWVALFTLAVILFLIAPWLATWAIGTKLALNALTLLVVAAITAVGNWWRAEPTSTNRSDGTGY